MALEKIVRPFESAKPFEAKTLAPSAPAVRADGDEDLALIEWEGGASSTVISQEPPPGTNGLEFDSNGATPTTEKARVENPNAPDQFVDVNRMKQIKFVNTATGVELPLKFDLPPGVLAPGSNSPVRLDLFQRLKKVHFGAGLVVIALRYDGTIVGTEGHTRPVAMFPEFDVESIPITTEPNIAKTLKTQPHFKGVPVGLNTTEEDDFFFAKYTKTTSDVQFTIGVAGFGEAGRAGLTARIKVWASGGPATQELARASVMDTPDSSASGALPGTALTGVTIKPNGSIEWNYL